MFGCVVREQQGTGFDEGHVREEKGGLHQRQRLCASELRARRKNRPPDSSRTAEVEDRVDRTKAGESAREDGTLSFCRIAEEHPNRTQVLTRYLLPRWPETLNSLPTSVDTRDPPSSPSEVSSRERRPETLRSRRSPSRRRRSPSSTP